MPETWRMIADDLAARLQHHAAAAGAVSSDPAIAAAWNQGGCPHPLHKADPECPFCEDRRAHRRYLAKREKARS